MLGVADSAPFGGVRARGFLSSAVVLILLVVLTGFFENFVRGWKVDAERAPVVVQSHMLHGGIIDALTTKVSLVQNIRVLVESNNYSVDDGVFQSLARVVLEREAGEIRSLQVAPDGIIRFVYPLEDNRQVIGLDILGHDEQGRRASAMVPLGEPQLQGPLDLIQGGKGLIARLPLYRDVDMHRTFWGFATVVLNLEPFLDRVCADISTRGYDVALRRIGSGVTPGAVFYGPEGLFSQDAVLSEIDIYGSRWQLAVLPRGGWAATWPMSLMIWILGVFFAMSGAVMVFRQTVMVDSLDRARIAADQANVAKSTFLTNMSHELRTPLNAVLGFAQLLQHQPGLPLHASQRDHSNQILRAGKYLLGLIDEILDLSKIEAGKVEINIEPLSLPAIVEECLGLVETAAAKRSIVLVNDCKTCTDVVLGDYVRLREVVVNLLTNAIKYNFSGGEVRVSFAEADLGRVRLFVSDTGYGIPEDKQANVFKPFERLGREATNVEGTGIGLSITRELMELMEGSIDFESEVDVGTTFWVEMRTTKRPPKQEVQVSSVDERPIDWQVLGPPGSAHYTGLYVEDNPANQLLMRHIISMVPNMELDVVSSGEEAMQSIAESTPDIVFMDLHLPGMSGCEALNTLKSNPKTRGIPVAVLSAEVRQCEIQEACSSGFDAYLTKPIDIRNLTLVIGDFLGPR